MLRHDRVREHSPAKSNERIDRATQRRILRAGGESKAALSRRLEQLDSEWDMERVLETNASALALGGVLLGLFVNRKFFAIPCFVLPFLLQHAIQGWCPPVPMFRSRGVRTRKEIDTEKFAVKALRGDFAEVDSRSDPNDRARAAWRAANA
ncbi:MAG: hypothetical protein QOG12_1809 [Verrucomicrobiota bacterium]|jgi:hypothetical protein